MKNQGSLLFKARMALLSIFLFLPFGAVLADAGEIELAGTSDGFKCEATCASRCFNVLKKQPDKRYTGFECRQSHALNAYVCVCDFESKSLVTLEEDLARDAHDADAPRTTRRCSNASLRGTYGFVAQGTTLADSPLPPALQGPFASSGVSVFDGRGHFTLTATSSFNGVIQPTTVEGTYQVNSDTFGEKTIRTSDRFIATA